MGCPQTTTPNRKPHGTKHPPLTVYVVRERSAIYAEIDGRGQAEAVKTLFSGAVFGVRSCRKAEYEDRNLPEHCSRGLYSIAPTETPSKRRLLAGVLCNR